MTKVQISFWGMDSIMKFIEIVENYSYHVDLACGSYLVDAKSMLAVFAMRLASDLELIIHSEQCDDLLNDLEVYIDQRKLENQARAISVSYTHLS